MHWAVLGLPCSLFQIVRILIAGSPPAATGARQLHAGALGVLGGLPGSLSYAMQILFLLLNPPCGQAGVRRCTGRCWASGWRCCASC